MGDWLEDIVHALLSAKSIGLDSDLHDSLEFYTKIDSLDLSNLLNLDNIYECIGKVSKYAIAKYGATPKVAEHDFRKILKRLIDEILFNINLAASDKQKILKACRKWFKNDEKGKILQAFDDIVWKLAELQDTIFESQLENIESNKEDILSQFSTIDGYYGSKCIDYSERACTYAMAIVERHIEDRQLCNKLTEFLESYFLARELPSVIKIIEVIDTLLPNYFNCKCINPKNVDIVIRETEEHQEKCAADTEEVKIENSKPIIEQEGGELRKKHISILEEESNSEELKYEEDHIERNAENESNASTKDTMNLKVELENKNNTCFLVTITSNARVQYITERYLSTTIGSNLPLKECCDLFCFQFLTAFRNYISLKLKQDFNENTEFNKFISFKCLFRKLLTYSEADQFAWLEILRSISNESIKVYEYLFETSNGFDFTTKELPQAWKEEFRRRFGMFPYNEILKECFKSHETMTFKEYINNVVDFVRTTNLPRGIGGITLKNRMIYIHQFLELKKGGTFLTLLHEMGHHMQRIDCNTFEDANSPKSDKMFLLVYPYRRNLIDAVEPEETKAEINPEVKLENITEDELKSGNECAEVQLIKGDPKFSVRLPDNLSQEALTDMETIVSEKDPLRGYRKIEGGELIEHALFNKTHLLLYSKGEEALFEDYGNRSLQEFQEYFTKKNVPVKGEQGLQLKSRGEGLILRGCGFELLRQPNHK